MRKRAIPVKRSIAHDSPFACTFRRAAVEPDYAPTESRIRWEKERLLEPRNEIVTRIMTLGSISDVDAYERAYQ